MQKIDCTVSLSPAGAALRASYSASSLLRRALLGLVLIALFTSTSAWLLHATTTESAQSSASRTP